MAIKQVIKQLAKGTLTLPIYAVQSLLSAVGSKKFLQGDVFDDLLEARTRVATRGGTAISFHTPNALARFRADTFNTKEPETLDWIDGFDPDSVFWDIGANVGTYSIYAAARHESVRVVAVEPSIENTYLLNRNISTNGFSSRIAAFPFALSDATGSNLFKHITLQLGGALNSFGVDYSYDGKVARFIEQYQVFGFRADDLEMVFGISQPNYIKIDVDGIEHLIARGARKVLSSPLLRSVLIELNFEFPEQRDEIIAIFSECGLTLKEYKHAEEFYGQGSYSGIYNHIFERRLAQPG